MLYVVRQARAGVLLTLVHHDDEPLTGKEESNKSDHYSWVHLVEEPKKYSRLLYPNPVVFFAHSHYYLKTIATTKKM